VSRVRQRDQLFRVAWTEQSERRQPAEQRQEQYVKGSGCCERNAAASPSVGGPGCGRPSGFGYGGQRSICQGADDPHGVGRAEKAVDGQEFARIDQFEHSVFGHTRRQGDFFD
jgi:hypothetical protein